MAVTGLALEFKKMLPHWKHFHWNQPHFFSAEPTREVPLVKIIPASYDGFVVVFLLKGYARTKQ